MKTGSGHHPGLGPFGLFHWCARPHLTSNVMYAASLSIPLFSFISLTSTSPHLCPLWFWSQSSLKNPQSDKRLLHPLKIFISLLCVFTCSHVSAYACGCAYTYMPVHMYVCVCGGQKPTLGVHFHVLSPFLVWFKTKCLMAWTLPDS